LGPRYYYNNNLNGNTIKTQTQKQPGLIKKRMGKILQILVEPDRRLRLKSEKIDTKKINEQEMRQLSEDLKETMLKKDGIGLAAPQIGQNIRLIVVSAKNGPLVMFNPKIIKKSFSKDWEEEGCLSVPFYFGEVKRSKSITCTFFDQSGQENKIKASGLLARVTQHEIDHLDGILFIDKAKNLKKIEEAEIEKIISKK
jgi:peptide deformylase